MAAPEKAIEITAADTRSPPASPAEQEDRHMSVDAQREEAYRKRLVFPDLASSNPNTSTLWYYVKHPYARFFVALFVMVMDTVGVKRKKRSMAMVMDTVMVLRKREAMVMVMGMVQKKKRKMIVVKVKT